MATTSFYKFTLLPPEIQQQIWIFAAESTPGAHFFIYADPDEESDTTRRDRFIRRTTDFSPWGPDLALAVPADDRSIIRTAKQKHKDDFVLGTYRDKGVTKNVIVRYETDLIILCPTDLGKLCWGRIRAECPPHLMHLALEYDPTWPQFGQSSLLLSEKDKEACKCLAWLATTSAYWSRLVWFIDYSLKRRPGVDGYLDDDRNEFWCATGRFVQVWPEDEDWDTGPEDGVHKFVASLDHDREARLALAEYLEEMGIDVGQVNIPLEEPDDPDDSDQLLMDEFRSGAYFGVLAFEPW